MDELGHGLAEVDLARLNQPVGTGSGNGTDDAEKAAMPTG